MDHLRKIEVDEMSQLTCAKRIASKKTVFVVATDGRRGIEEGGKIVASRSHLK